jgi:hypothetical protein
MNSYPEMAGHYWPRNTLRAAFLSWQAQEDRLVKARQRLALEYQATFRLAEQLEIEAGQGILRAARSCLDPPQAPLILKVRTRLARMFVLQGKSFFRRVPAILALELAHYAAEISQICRLQGDLAGRLRLAQAVLTLFCRQAEFRRPDFFRLALTSPESARLLFQVRQKRLKERQAIQDLLSKSRQL